MKTILTRLKQTRGETLVESMVAILIFTFASILFLTLVTSAANINTTVKEADESFQAQQRAVEAAPGESAPSAQAVLYDDKNNNGIFDEGETVSTANMKVVADDEDGALYAYFLQEGGEGT